jgi:hypothetical protein
MIAPKIGRALLGVGVLGMLFGLSLVGIAALGAGTAPAATNAHLSAATTPACLATVGLTVGPATINIGAPMVGIVSYSFSGLSAHACAQNAHVQVVGLPLGCPVETTSVFSCVPMAVGTYHVQTTVFAQNTATTVVDSVVVR